MLAQYKALGWTGCTGEKFFHKFNWWKNLKYFKNKKATLPRVTYFSSQT